SCSTRAGSAPCTSTASRCRSRTAATIRARSPILPGPTGTTFTPRSASLSCAPQNLRRSDQAPDCRNSHLWRELMLRLRPQYAVALVLAAAMSVTCDIVGASAQALQKVSLRLDWVISGYHAPYFVGIKNGYYKEEGLELVIEPGNGSGNVTQAIGNGNGDF